MPEIRRRVRIYNAYIVRLGKMKTRRIIAGASILIALFVHATGFAEQQTYTVKKGDTLYGISKLFNTNPEALKKLNGLQNDMLGIGQILKVSREEPAAAVKAVETPAIPPSMETAADAEHPEQQKIQQAQQARKETQTYAVRAGDTILGIARSFSLDVNTLAAANNIRNKNRLSVGQVLVIPGENKTPNETQAAAAVPAQTVNRMELKPAVNQEDLTVRDRLVEAGFNMLGVRYRFGGTSEKTGLDCSALVKNLFAKFGLTLPRSSREQYKQGEKVAEEDLQKGDLVFFSSGGKTPTHVGIYIGDNQFLHAASRAKKVIISDLGKTWYGLRYLGARRIMDLWWEDIKMPLNGAPQEGNALNLQE